MTIISSLFGGLWGYVAVAAVASSVAGYAAHHWDLATIRQDKITYQALELKDAKTLTDQLEAQAKALAAVKDEQHLLDQEVTVGAVAEAKAQETIHAHVVTVVKSVTQYVTQKADTILVPCIPYGFVRVLDAAALSTSSRPVSPSDLALPTGQSDDACAPIKASDLAAAIAANYGTAEENAEQLNSLEAFVAKMVTDANK